MLLRIIRFAILMVVKLLKYGIYPISIRWAKQRPLNDWSDTRLILILNHTSLFEFLFGSALPLSYLWRMAAHLSFPVAQETLEKPFLGFIYRCMAPNVIPISRKRDQSWHDFQQGIKKDSIVIMMPEGRMKRPSGLDKHGNAMTIRAGFTELLPKFSGEKMLLVHSGGLHHVFPPGARLPRLGQSIQAVLESVDIDQFIHQHSSTTIKDSIDAMIKDLEDRRDHHVATLKEDISSNLSQKETMI